MMIEELRLRYLLLLFPLYGTGEEEGASRSGSFSVSVNYEFECECEFVRYFKLNLWN